MYKIITNHPQQPELGYHDIEELADELAALLIEHAKDPIERETTWYTIEWEKDE